MNNNIILDELEESINGQPGALLAAQREHLKYSVEYVADKLHLRVRIIELLENDDYANMPEPVFIRGYLRAYAKLLGIPSDPLMSSFNKSYSGEKKLERALWQSRRESNKAEHVVRWLTTAFAVVVLVAVAMWWQANKENENVFTTSLRPSSKPTNNLSENEIRLTDLSKMRSLLSSGGSDINMEQSSE